MHSNKSSGKPSSQHLVLGLLCYFVVTDRQVENGMADSMDERDTEDGWRLTFCPADEQGNARCESSATLWQSLRAWRQCFLWRSGAGATSV